MKATFPSQRFDGPNMAAGLYFVITSSDEPRKLPTPNFQLPKKKSLPEANPRQAC